MKTNSVKILSAVVAGLFVLGTTVYAQGIDSRTSRPVMEGKAIAKPEAEKKYPPPSSGYPTGERDPHDPSGIVASPYPPHQKFNCSKIAHGAFVLDTTANKVFVRP
ncbi:MAG: hypothetical protein DMF03_01150 [Verrucomicrobia bacterium]|nr:MAG: hypothetical protein DMF03_01150 [Verrucomicrobiota bacterium]